MSSQNPIHLILRLLLTSFGEPFQGLENKQPIIKNIINKKLKLRVLNF